MVELIGGHKGSGLNFGSKTLDSLKAHKLMLGLHYQVLGCHCECMGMMAENQVSPSEDLSYKMKDFKRVMVKWGLVNKEGKVNI